MNKTIITLSAVTVLLSFPVALAAVDLVPLPGIVHNIDPIIEGLITIVWSVFGAFSVIMFLIAAILFLTAQGDPTKVEKARSAFIWGTVGVVVGLVAFSIPFIIKALLGI